MEEIQCKVIFILIIERIEYLGLEDIFIHCDCDSPDAAPAPPDVDSSRVATASNLEMRAFSSAADISSTARTPSE